MDPEYKVGKVYQVKLQNPLTSEYIAAFAQGMYFEFENITTLPAELDIIDSHTALVTLYEDAIIKLSGCLAVSEIRLSAYIDSLWGK